METRSLVEDSSVLSAVCVSEETEGSATEGEPATAGAVKIAGGGPDGVGKGVDEADTDSE